MGRQFIVDCLGDISQNPLKGTDFFNWIKY